MTKAKIGNDCPFQLQIAILIKLKLSLFLALKSLLFSLILLFSQTELNEKSSILFFFFLYLIKKSIKFGLGLYSKLLCTILEIFLL